MKFALPNAPRMVAGAPATTNAWLVLTIATVTVASCHVTS